MLYNALYMLYNILLYNTAHLYTDILHRNFPNLITSQLKCLRCNQTEETNDHLWQCPESQIYIYNAS